MISTTPGKAASKSTRGLARVGRALLLTVLTVLVASCEPRVGEGQFRCQPGQPNACPPGWLCLEYGPEHRCFSSGVGVCLNGVLEPGEQCDGTDFGGYEWCESDGPGESLRFCLLDCTVYCTTCGNGRVELTADGEGEQCDDGNGEAGDGCSPACTIEYCGNGIQDAGEECDDGNNLAGDGCSPICHAEGCGNGQVDGELGEQCDDGNLRSHDGCSSGCTVEAPTWKQWVPAIASGRVNHEMVYDSARERIVLFGGNDGDQLLADTWEFDGEGWRETTPVKSPPARESFGMAYDSARGVVVIMGGITGAQELLGDVWEYDGTEWTERTFEEGPGPRMAPAMTYDAARQRVVLFGGYIDQGIYDDFWTYDGSEWYQATPHPLPLAAGDRRMVYDAARQRVVLALSHDIAWLEQPFFQTWEYDGEDWTDTTGDGTSPPPRFGFMLAYDSDRQRVLLHSGGTGDDLVGEVWQYDGPGWSLVSASGDIPRRVYGAASYHEVTHQLIVFGGGDYEGLLPDTWALREGQWQMLSPRLGPSARVAAAAAFDEGRQRLVMFGGSATHLEIEDASPLGDTWVHDGRQWLPLETQLSPSARHGTAMVYDAARDRVVLFGGLDTAGQALGDTWELVDDGWQQVETSDAPAGRHQHAMAYDPAAERVVLYGGASLPMGGELEDTWEYTGGGWVELTPGSTAERRRGHGLVYDASSDRLVLYGGVEGMALWGTTTWVFDGADWTALEGDGAHELTYFTMVFDRARERVVLSGGASHGFIYAGAWELVGDHWIEIQPVSSPPARFFAASAYDSVRRATVVFGGVVEGGAPISDETWALRYRSSHPEEICGNDDDDDGDGLVDALDPDCFWE